MNVLYELTNQFISSDMRFRLSVGIPAKTNLFTIRRIDRPDPNRPDRIRPDPYRPDPNRPDPNRPDPNRPDSNRPDPNQPDPNWPDPNQHARSDRVHAGSIMLSDNNVINPSRSKEFYNLVRPRGGKITPQTKIAITSLVLKISWRNFRGI